MTLETGSRRNGSHPGGCAPPTRPGLPGQAPFTRGNTGWPTLADPPEQTNPELTKANREILEDLNGGVTEITLRFGDDGIPLITNLDQLRRGPGRGTTWIWPASLLEAGASAPAAAGLLKKLWRENGISPDVALGSFRYDLLAPLARTGTLPSSPEQALEAAAPLPPIPPANGRRPGALAVDTGIYVEAGATAGWELGIAIATGVEYLPPPRLPGLSRPMRLPRSSSRLRLVRTSS